MSSAIIWCRNKDNIVGVNNDLPWHIPSDLQRFKRLTLGKNLVVGRKTYESFPNKTLPKRKLFILTRDNDYQVSEPGNHFIIPSVNSLPNDDFFIVGGASVYEMFLEKNPPEYVLDFVCDKEVEDQENKEITKLNKAIDILEEKYSILEEAHFEDGILLKLRVRKDVKTLDNFYQEIERNL